MCGEDIYIQRKISILSSPLFFFLTLLPFFLLLSFSRPPTRGGEERLGGIVWEGLGLGWVLASSFQTLVLFPSFSFLAILERGKTWPLKFANFFLPFYFAFSFFICCLGVGFLFSLWTFLPIWIFIVCYTYNWLARSYSGFQRTWLFTVGEIIAKVFEASVPPFPFSFSFYFLTNVKNL